MRRFFAVYAGLRAWQLQICEQVMQGPMVLPQTGKTLYLSPVARGKNQALNFYQQSGIGVLIGNALPHVAARMTWERHGLAILAQVHDELLLQAPRPLVREIETFVSHEMSKPIMFGDILGGVPASGDVGQNWATLTPIKDWKGP
jgi:DNA polymerase I-like protein with 3'-5' exonuclease and polymerase domains